MEERTYEYSVVIPVFQGGEHLPLLYREIKKVFTGLASSFEIILVDDRGKANSWDKMKALKKLDPQRIQMIRMVKNLGQHSATMMGILVSQGSWIITIDEDLQHPPHCIQEMINFQKEEKKELVYAFYAPTQHSRFRNKASRLLRHLLHLSVPSLYFYYSSFRLFKASPIQRVLKNKKTFPFLDAYLGQEFPERGHIQINQAPSKNSQSAYHWRRLFWHALGILYWFAKRPIAVLILIGAILLGLGLSVVLSDSSFLLNFGFSFSLLQFSAFIWTIPVRKKIIIVNQDLIEDKLI